MAEKRGHLEKMKYDFPTEAVLEIWKDSLNRWHRVTSQVFRSYDGPRRYTRPIKQPGHETHLLMYLLRLLIIQTDRFICL